MEIANDAQPQQQSQSQVDIDNKDDKNLKKPKSKPSTPVSTPKSVNGGSNSAFRRGNLTNAERLRICLESDANPALSQEALAEWAKNEFNLASPLPGTISNILRKKREYENMNTNELLSKRPRIPSCPELDSVLADWVIECQAQNVALTGELIKEKGRLFALQLGLGDKAPDFSNGWLQNFKSRHNFKTNPSRYDTVSSVDYKAELLGHANLSALMNNEAAFSHIQHELESSANKDDAKMDVKEIQDLIQNTIKILNASDPEHVAIYKGLRRLLHQFRDDSVC